MVNVAARVFAQDQACPVERAREDPGRLAARALGHLDLHRAPLLPDHRRRERDDQHHDDHRGQQRRAALVALWAALHGPSTVSRVSSPLVPLPSAKLSTMRTPLGGAWRATTPPAVPAAGGAATLPVDWQLLQALPW